MLSIRTSSMADLSVGDTITPLSLIAGSPQLDCTAFEWFPPAPV